MKITLIERELKFTSSVFIKIQICCVLPEISHQKDISCLCDLKVSCKCGRFKVIAVL